MKKLTTLMMIVILMLAVGSFTLALAEETGGSTFSSPNGNADGFAEFLNEQDYLDHNHQYSQRDERENELGIGLDIVVYADTEDKVALLDEVVVEVKRDFNNDEGSLYVVARLNLFKFITDR